MPESSEDLNEDLEEESQPVQQRLPHLQSPRRVHLRLSQLSHGRRTTSRKLNGTASPMLRRQKCAGRTPPLRLVGLRISLLSIYRKWLRRAEGEGRERQVGACGGGAWVRMGEGRGFRSGQWEKTILFLL